MKPDGHTIGQSEGEVTKSELLRCLQDLEARVKELEQETHDLREELHEERKARKEAVKNEQIARTQTIQKAKDDVNSEVEELHETVVAEQKTRSRNDSKLAKRITGLENKVGVETNPANDVGEKLERLVRNGPSDVTDRTGQVHDRAQSLLQNASDWGTLTNNKNGRCVQFVAPDVKPFLEAQYDREFTTTEIKRIFRKVDELAEDSLRQVRWDKNREGYHRLIVWANSDEDTIVR